jgi:hypothetical protein
VPPIDIDLAPSGANPKHAMEKVQRSQGSYVTILTLTVPRRSRRLPALTEHHSSGEAVVLLSAAFDKAAASRL